MLSFNVSEMLIPAPLRQIVSDQLTFSTCDRMLGYENAN
jgi:hypothetical protein